MGQACQSSTSDRSPHWRWAIEPFLICSLNCSLAISDRKFNFKAKIGYPSTTRETWKNREKPVISRDISWVWNPTNSCLFWGALDPSDHGPWRGWPWKMVLGQPTCTSHHDMQQSCKQFECFWWYIATISCSHPALAIPATLWKDASCSRQEVAV